MEKEEHFVAECSALHRCIQSAEIDWKKQQYVLCDTQSL